MSSTDRGRLAALTIQDRRQICPSDADPTNVKGMLGKGAVSNFGVRATSPGAIGILSEIFALDLGGERRFRFAHDCLLICLLSVGRIDVVGAHQAEHSAEGSNVLTVFDAGWLFTGYSQAKPAILFLPAEGGWL